MGFFAAIKEIGGFAASLSSLVSSFFSLIRIIQRCSATIEFKAKLSPDTKNVFSWATDLLVTFFNNFLPLEHLTEKDSLILLGFSFYLSFPFIFLSIYKSASTALLSMNSALYFGLAGYGMRLLPTADGWAYVLFYPIVGGVIYAIYWFCCKNKEISAFTKICLYLYFGVIPAIKKILDVNLIKEEYNEWDIHIGTWITLIIFCVLSDNIFRRKEGFAVTMVIIYTAIVVLEFFITRKFLNKIGGFLLKVFQKLSSVFIIPIITYLTELSKSHEGIETEIIVYISLVPLFSTFLLSCLLTFLKHPSLINDYKEGRHYYEIFDVVCKYAYAFCSNYEKTEVICIVIEVLTIIVIVVVRPFRFYNRYVLDIGECIVVLIANIVSMFYKGVFSIYITLTIMCLGILPIIISLYVFFIFDFGNNINGENENVADFRIINTVNVVIIIIGFTLYGWCVPVLYHT